MSKILVLSLLSLAPLSHAALVSETFDAYPGATDPGWTGPWTDTAGSAISVTNSTPVNGGGSYINGDVTRVDDLSDQGIRRTLSTSVIDTKQAYTVSWDVRFDNLDTFDTFGDRIHFATNNGGSYASNDTASWLVGVVGADRASAGNWYFYNNSGSGNGAFNDADLFDTGMALVQGNTYSFLISVDPATRTYDATITDLTTSQSVTETGLEFRNQTGTTGYQNFIFGTPVPNDTRVREFSLDNLQFNGVPEPATSLLSLLGGAFLLRRRR